jgi:hypothetical protein
MRIHLEQWERGKIKKGKLSDWRRAAIRVPLGKQVKVVNLLVDSTDFRLSGKRRTSKKSEGWSYKLNLPTQ